MVNRTRSIVSLVTIFALVFVTLTYSVSAQRYERTVSPSETDAPAAVLYSNANILTGSGNGANAANTSAVATGESTFGFSMNGTAGTISLGDRFTIFGPSTISSIVFYPYSTSTYGSPPASPFTGATVNIWSGQPGSGGAVVATSSTFGSSVWTGIYRVNQAALTGATRPVFAVTTNFPNTPLAAGNYWATITVTGIVSPGVATSCFGPPVMNSNGTQQASYPIGGAAPLSVQSTDGGATWVLPADATSGTRPLVPITINGSGPTAAGVDVSGRVLTSADGRGLRGTVVSMTDQAGRTRNTITGPNGVYRFADVESGQTYVVRVASRRFSFTPRVIQIVDSITDLDFVAGQ